ncbi:hypothetical protein [Methylorubrum podarium]|jgi:hypothetical protein|uniref:hypothetical protein n=1 Tax=Methylorubrum podarium TaxID=200476 RepID=UPI001EE35E80|nr:hypothetical protein [Methylorubrum podarium]GJE73066.1 hypothetical protein CHKEEEPN_4629 [Methylorubrum podarium]
MSDKKTRREPLKRCPAKDNIMAMQIQLFDNGPKPGRGRSQHSIKIEAYCDGRLDLLRPYWSRVVQLIDPKRFMAWVNDQRASGTISDQQYEQYDLAHQAVTMAAAMEGIEFAKMGHIGSARENLYYDGQFVTVVKQQDGGLQFEAFIDGEHVSTSSFLFDRAWRRGGARRKFFGFYDPNGMYAAMKAEIAQRAEADSRAKRRDTGSIGGSPWE